MYHSSFVMRCPFDAFTMETSDRVVKLFELKKPRLCLIQTAHAHVRNCQSNLVMHICLILRCSACSPRDFYLFACLSVTYAWELERIIAALSCAVRPMHPHGNSESSRQNLWAQKTRIVHDTNGSCTCAELSEQRCHVYLFDTPLVCLFSRVISLSLPVLSIRPHGNSKRYSEENEMDSRLRIKAMKNWY